MLALHFFSGKVTSAAWKVITEYVGNNSLSQLTNIFVTSKTWNNIGGLPGMCLSIRSAGAPDVKLHGPNGIMKMYQATENFVILYDFRVLYHNPETDYYVDSAVHVKHVALHPNKEKPLISPEPKYCKWLPDMDFTKKGEFKENILKIKNQQIVMNVDANHS